MAVRIDGVTPAAPPPLETIKQELTTEWLRRDIATRLKTQADAILAEAKRTSLEAAAAKFKLPVLKQPAPLQRGQGGQALSAAVFDAKRGEIVLSQTANGVEFAIIRIEDVVRDDEAIVPERLAQAETAVRASVQRDLIAALDRLARDRAKIKLYPDMMRAALGDTAETSPTEAPAPAKSKTP
jgi:peptidyl-prolyl cis-trans isomerase D